MSRRGFGKVLAHIVLALAVISLPAAAPARERAGVKMPDTIQVAGKTLVLNGMGVREATVMNIDVYVAGLYLETKSTSAGEIIRSKQVKRLVMMFVRDVDRKDIAEAYTEGFKKNSGKGYAAIEERSKKLISWLPKMKSGKTMTLTYTPSGGVEVRVADEVKGTIAGDDFAVALWSIWLGDHPPNKGLKTGLLGGK